MARRGTKVRDGGSVPAQSKANAAMYGGSANAELEEKPEAQQYEVSYGGLKQLFEDDSSNESYNTPFTEPEDLMAHFVELEENNLSLIQ